MTEKKYDDWNPQEASIQENQRQAYDKMREQCPVAYSKFLGWSVFRHEDIRAVLADPETFSNASQFLAIPNGMDPPESGGWLAIFSLWCWRKGLTWGQRQSCLTSSSNVP